MAVRSALATLIQRVRLLIADPAGDTQQFADQDIQDALDQRREDVRMLPLRPEPTFAPGSAMQWLDYYADLTAWDNDATLQSGSYATVTPATSEPLVGHWALSVSQPPPVFVTGRVYDVFGAAADLLRAWAATELLSFDFTSSQRQQFSRSQKHAQLLKMAASYDAQARPRNATSLRPDEAPAAADSGRLDDRGLPWGTGYRAVR